MTLTEFLLARIAEDEAWLESQTWFEDCQECGFGQQPQSPYSRPRLMAECEAKRRIVGEFSEKFDWWILATLALPYAEHPDFRPEWSTIDHE